jgi:hypothetical protein
MQIDDRDTRSVLSDGVLPPSAGSLLDRLIDDFDVRKEDMVCQHGVVRLGVLPGRFEGR